MQAELQQVSAARQEADRKRKQAEQQIQEVSLRLADLDRTRGDLGDKAAKCQVPCFSLNTSYLVSRDALNTKLILRFIVNELVISNFVLPCFTKYETPCCFITLQLNTNASEAFVYIFRGSASI